jgi:galactokinase
MIRLKAPGRICLFGEHQDYLNLPVIAMAISKYISLEAKRISEPKFLINLPDIDESMEIFLNNGELDYVSKRDYLRSGYNQFQRMGVKFSKGYDIKITGDIPINAGVASSSALVLAWLYFLNTIGGTPLKDELALANEGYNAEVREFGEAGGKMDFFSSAFGNIIYLDSSTIEPTVDKYDLTLGGFVLGDSLEKKDTVDDLIRIKNTSLDGFKTLKEINSEFDLFNSKIADIEEFLPNLNKNHQKIIVGQLKNRDLTQDAKILISSYYNQSIKSEKDKLIFYQQLGILLNEHHRQLNSNIGISTNKINTMLSECVDIGALGGKINGSGFGGTMFALTTPRKESALAAAIENAGGKAYLIKTSKGVEIY